MILDTLFARTVWSNYWRVPNFYVTIAERFVRSCIKNRCVGVNGRSTGLIITTAIMIRM